MLESWPWLELWGSISAKAWATCSKEQAQWRWDWVGSWISIRLTWLSSALSQGTLLSSWLSFLAHDCFCVREGPAAEGAHDCGCVTEGPAAEGAHDCGCMTEGPAAEGAHDCSCMTEGPAAEGAHDCGCVTEGPAAEGAHDCGCITEGPAAEGAQALSPENSLHVVAPSCYTGRHNPVNQKTQVVIIQL